MNFSISLFSIIGRNKDIKLVEDEIAALKNKTTGSPATEQQQIKTLNDLVSRFPFS